MKKFIASAFLISTVFALASCGGKTSKDFDSDQFAEEEYQIPQDVQEFDIVDSEAAAEEINQEVQEEIEEVEVRDRVFFDVNASELTSDAQKILDNQIAWLKSDSSIKIILEGHCDERGTREYNLALGERRANSAKQYLVAQGIEANRIKTISYGKERPAFVGSSSEIWAKNRRSVTVIEE
ncbi:MAG: peptidoglycan-associated lipoprotein [Myxococcota bacterium]|jgi:peptidoglycan-associated lipoprotein